MSKFKDILKIGTEIAKPFIPGAAGSMLDAVSSTIGRLSSSSLPSETSATAIRQLARDNDEQTAVIFEMAAEIRAMKAEIAELKK